MSGLLIDTDVFSDYLLGRDEAADFLEYARDDLHLSVITLSELGSRIRNDAEWVALQAAAQALILHPVDAEVARVAALQRGKTLAHCLLAAMAQVHGLRIVAVERKAYPGCEVLVPYSRIV
jgi:predicted nucleic acid-binding protein